MSSSVGLVRCIERVWYESRVLYVPLLPLSWIFALATGLRRQAYRLGWLRTMNAGLPVIVVGNITVGGAGKTPLVIWLVERLREMGFRPGIVSRGYGGDGSALRVDRDSDPARVGDEPVLLAARLRCPVAVAPDRVAAVRLLDSEGVDVIVSDDGLQHYRLARDVEIAVVDGERGLGNGHLLPAGPLREPPRRLRSVDAVIGNGGGERCRMSLEIEQALPLQGGQTRALADFRDRPVHAVAGIGNPARFFTALRRQGLEVLEHPFPDHHRFQPSDLAFGDGAPVLMTEKDAVKCRDFISGQLWVVPARARLTSAAETELDTLLKNILARPRAALI